MFSKHFILKCTHRYLQAPTAFVKMMKDTLYCCIKFYALWISVEHHENVQKRKGLHCDDATLLLSDGCLWLSLWYSVCVCAHAHVHIDIMTHLTSRIKIKQDKQHLYTFWVHTSLSPQTSNAHLKDFNKLLNINHEGRTFFLEVISFTGNSLQGMLLFKYSSATLPKE